MLHQTIILSPDRSSEMTSFCRPLPSISTICCLRTMRQCQVCHIKMCYIASVNGTEVELRSERSVPSQPRADFTLVHSRILGKGGIPDVFIMKCGGISKTMVACGKCLMSNLMMDSTHIRKIKKKLIILSRLTTLINLFQQFKSF